MLGKNMLKIKKEMRLGQEKEPNHTTRATMFWIKAY